MKGKRVFTNLIVTFASVAIAVVGGLLFTPYIVNAVGSEAYGYVALATSTVNYITIITIALNSVAGRFISIAFFQDNPQEAKVYYSSVIITNTLIGLALLLVSIPFILNLDSIINIPEGLVNPVKILFTFTFFSFSLSIISSSFAAAPFIANKIYINTFLDAIATVLRFAFVIFLFYVFENNVAWVGAATILTAGIIFGVQYVIKRRLLPDIKCKRALFQWKKIIVMIKSGMWNSVTSVAQLLSDGLDLLLANLFVSPYDMGQLAIAKTVPIFTSSVISKLANIFKPSITYHYAKGDTESLIYEIKKSMRVTSFFANIPFCFFVIFGDLFFSLWTPGQNTQMLYILSVLSIQADIVSGAIVSLYTVFLITNKLKVNSIFWSMTGVFDIILVLILVKTSSLGIYAVAGVSTTVGLIANATFVPLYAAKCLRVKRTTFYPELLRYMMATLILIGLLLTFKSLLPAANTWLRLIVIVLSVTVMAIIVNTFIILNRSDRHTAKDMIMNILIKHRHE